MIPVEQSLLPHHFLKRDCCPCCGSSITGMLKKMSYTDPLLIHYFDTFYPDGSIEFKYLEDASFFLEECLECGLVFQSEIPDDQLMHRLYEKWLNPKAAFDHEFRISKKNLVKMLDDYYELFRLSLFLGSKHGKNRSELSFFDFGSGWGTWLKRAKALGIQVCGCEISHSKVSYAQQIGIKMVTWNEIPMNKFDFIRTEQVFEHIATPAQTLEHLSFSLAMSTQGAVLVNR